MAFLLRWLIAFILLAATWNPTQWNFINWVRANGTDNLPVTVLGGLVLLVGYVVYLRATFRSIGPLGVGLVLALCAAVIWVLVYYGLLGTGNAALNQWLAVFIGSLVLGIGMSWSIIRRRISGQADVDDVDQE
ncbi:DUF6524 family protein [Pararhodobacter aggregans]|uniref:Uncharacterized protein n=1 Tax=Pararhodobacter aggregans TaxID=404875 RepID=A0A2T7UN67_9RHOB|nr:DUF6524 family protein [Pararhodobacter aggregans]PTX02529.1 hypothetical protein C8N33_105352 [Pararhodobacter aggregans]PVE46132.1 hypothetical protein DDE23_18250 [Pararhodobacter aggregans]